jgi:hypothetical protein
LSIEGAEKLLRKQFLIGYLSYNVTMLLRSFLILTLITITATTFAQSRKKKKKGTRTEQSSQPTTLDPSSKKEYEPRASRKSSNGPTYESEREYYERKEQLEKTRRKNEKLSQKPQYSDPSYFGHKRPPKRHKAGKLKYCKECGIRH